MRLDLDHIYALSLSSATQELHRAVQDVYTTRTRNAWRNLLNHLRAMRLIFASDLEIEGGVESLHSHASLAMDATQAKDLRTCVQTSLRSVLFARKVPGVKALKVFFARV